MNTGTNNPVYQPTAMTSFYGVYALPFVMEDAVSELTAVSAPGEIASGCSSSAYRVGTQLVKIFTPARTTNLHRLSAPEIVARTEPFLGNPLFEQHRFGFQSERSAYTVSDFHADIQPLSRHALGFDLLFYADVPRLLLSAMAFLDVHGVLHRDLCEGNIGFVSDGRTPFIYDFDKMSVTPWSPDREIAPHLRDQIVYGFESESTSLRQHALNVDDLLDNLIMETAYWVFERREGDMDKALRLLREYLTMNVQEYHPRLNQAIASHDAREIFDLRLRQIEHWLNQGDIGLEKLYTKKKIHLLMRCLGMILLTEKSANARPHLRKYLESSETNVVTLLKDELETLNARLF